MSLKSSTKTDVNTTELVLTIDAETFEAAVEQEYSARRKTFRSRDSERERFQESLLKRNSAKALSMREL